MTAPSTTSGHLAWVIGAISATEFYTPDHETLYVRFASGETEAIDLFEDMDEEESERAA